MSISISSGALTKPEKTKGPYQDHFFLILCENLAISTVVGDGTRKKVPIGLLCSRRWRKKWRTQKRLLLLGTEERVTRLTTPSGNRLPESRLRFVPMCTLLGGYILQGLGHVFVLAQNQPRGVHIRIFEGSVHMRSVPVITDATPEGRVALSSQEVSVYVVANNLPAPTDRRRLPVNKDIVGMEKGCFAIENGRKKLLYKGAAEAPPLFQSETASIAHMRSARDLRMMIQEILNVNNVLYSK
jgi:hypothetical protein